MTGNMELVALQVHANAQAAASRLRQIFADAGIEAACYALRIRIKEKAKVVEKVERKRKEKPDYDVFSMTDIIGVRLIALFRAELPDLLGKTLRLIQHESDIRPNPFVKESLEETIVYTADATNASFNVLLKTYMSQYGITFVEEYSDKGYSSLHLVCRLDHQLDFAAVPGYAIPVEIQIRSVFEDAWGEIDHKYGYSARSGKELTFADAQAALEPHFPVLKKFTDACAAYADTIRDMALGARAAETNIGKVISVESDGDVLVRFQQLAVPQALIDEYVKGRELRDTCGTGKNPHRAEEYINAAKHFADLTQRAAQELKEGTAHLFSYYTQMNFAFCLLSSGLPAAVRESIAVYARISRSFPAYPLVRFRLAQAYSKVGMTDEAIQLFEQVRREEQTIAAACTNSGQWPDYLPLTDHNHISSTLPKLLGYSYWVRAVHETPEESLEEQKADLMLAYSRTAQGLSVKPGDKDLANNLACYALDYLARESNDEFAKLLHCELVGYIQILENDIEHCEDIDILDTLLQAYNANGHHKEALQVADKLSQLLLGADLVDDTPTKSITNRVIQTLANARPENWD